MQGARRVDVEDASGRGGACTAMSGGVTGVSQPTVGGAVAMWIGTHGEGRNTCARMPQDET